MNGVYSAPYQYSAYKRSKMKILFIHFLIKIERKKIVPFVPFRFLLTWPKSQQPDPWFELIWVFFLPFSTCHPQSTDDLTTALSLSLLRSCRSIRIQYPLGFPISKRIIPPLFSQQNRKLGRKSTSKKEKVPPQAARAAPSFRWI